MFVGEPHRIYLPDVGRHRGGGRIFRGLRHIHTVLDTAGLAKEDISDLTKLRLDLVCALNVSEAGQPGAVDLAYLDPGARQRDAYQREHAPSIHAVGLNFQKLIDSLEEELARQRQTGRAEGGHTRAIVVGAYPDKQTAGWRVEEIRELAATAGVAVQDIIRQIRHKVDSKFVVGRGKLEEVVLRCVDLDAELIIFDHNLTGAQARAIAAFSDLKVIDRTQLILDIFAQHAQSRDGKLQVELAQLKYNLPRLTDLDAGMSRLTGGIGGRGPGETKLEINRRRARDRIARLEKEIEKLSKQRALRRDRRQRSAVPIVSIVGYTNAGKSTLLNCLTSSEVTVADQLFATLDPSSRRLRFPEEREAIVTDTVGFIRDLPPDLMKAFRATLEELETADLLLHVIDVSDPSRDEKKEAVESLLDELQLGAIPRVVVYNKADKVARFEARALAKREDGAAVCATTGEGLQQLVNLVAHRLWQTEALAEDDAWAAEAREQVQGPRPQPSGALPEVAAEPGVQSPAS